MAGDFDKHEYRKDLSHTTWDHIYENQQKRANLAPTYWDLVDGRPGHRVADVGCGPGYFTLRFAQMTGPTGHVHATDISPDALAHLRARLDPAHHANVTTEMLDIETTPLPDLHFDALFCTDVLHHADDIGAALRNMRLARAKLVVAEFDPEGPGELGPPRAERIAPARLIEMLHETGWKVRAWQVLPHEHYAIVAMP